MGTGRLIAALALVVCAVATIDAAGPKTRYERVLSQEQTLRVRTRRPAPLSQIRKVVAAYEQVARRYPTSGYADNALIQGADLSLAAHRIYGSDVDRDAAARMLEWLIDEYPHSSLQPKARQLLRRAKPAARTAPASRTVSAPAPALPSPTASLASSSSMRPTSAAAGTPGRTLPMSAAATAPPAAASAPAPVTPASTRTGASGPATLKHVTRTVIDDTVRVTLEFDGEVEFTHDRLNGPSRLYFDLKRTQTAPSLQDAVLSYADDTVRHIRLGRPKDELTRLVIDLTGVDKYSVFSLYNPYRLTVDLHRKAPRLEPLVARHPSAVATTAPRLASASIPRDLELERRIPPRPLPHPLADTPPPRVTSRRVASEVNRPLPPLVGARHGLPLSSAALRPPQAMPVAATVNTLASPRPLAASRRGLPLNTPANKAPRSTDVAARVNLPAAASAVAAGATAAGATVAGATAAGAASAGGSSARGASAGGASAGGTAATAAKLTPPPPLPNRASAPPTLPAPVTPSANAAGTFSLARQLGLGVSRIVIDAGHGGHDPGSLGSKITESEVVLDVALRLEKLLLQEPGFEVVLTRRTDVFIPLEERPAIANRLGADLFLSIHANASRNKQAHGVETYVLNFASNPEAEAVAARENSGANHTMSHLPEIVRAIALNNKLDESRDFARRVQETMVTRLKNQNGAVRDLGVKQAPFVVLVGTGMPAVLAEVAFISHQQEGSLLRTQSYRQRIAEALFEAVKDYQRALKQVGTVAAQTGGDTNDR